MKTTHCYIRKLKPWSTDFNLFEPNAFTVLGANNVKKEENEKEEKVYTLDTKTGKCIKTTVNRDPDPYKDWKMPEPRAHNILATPSPENFILHNCS